MLQDVIEPAKWSHFSCATFFADVYITFGGVFSICFSKLDFVVADAEISHLKLCN